MKNLHLSQDDKMIAGVLGGVAKYLKIDSTFMRVIWVLVTVFSGLVPGVVVYVVAWIIMAESSHTPTTSHRDEKKSDVHNRSIAKQEKSDSETS